VQQILLTTHCPFGDVQPCGEQEKHSLVQGPKQSVQLTANAVGATPPSESPKLAAALTTTAANFLRDRLIAATWVSTSSEATRFFGCAPRPGINKDSMVNPLCRARWTRLEWNAAA
jgi:hypothetical protein